MSTYPRFPNRRRTLGSTIPVVTTLLAGIAAAGTFLALQADHPMQVALDIGPFSGDSMQAAVLFGTVASGAFVIATLLAVHAEATDFDALNSEAQEQFLQDYGLKDRAEELRKQYRATHETIYERVRLLWFVGVGSLVLTMSALSVGTVRWLGVLTALLGIMIGLLIALREGNGPLYFAAGMLILITSGALAFSMR